MAKRELAIELVNKLKDVNTKDAIKILTQVLRDIAGLERWNHEKLKELPKRHRKATKRGLWRASYLIEVDRDYDNMLRAELDRIIDKD